MQRTRQRILDYLEHQHSASARQLAQAFGMTAANLRHHLGELQTRQLVTEIGERPIEGRGRPEKVYALSGAAQPDNLEGLSRILLAEYTAADLPKRSDTRLRRLGRRLAGKPTDVKTQLTARLMGAVPRLNALGYQANWEARPGGPQIVLGHCPYAAIISDHPELCRMDAELLHELLGEKVEQISKLEPGPDRLPICQFQIANKG